MIPVLTTERLTLRAAEMRDFEVYAAFRMSDRAKTVGGPYTYDEAFQQLCAINGQWTLRGYGRWMVADRATDAPLGIVGIYHPTDWPEAELAWSMFESGEGRGLAQEAALAARAYAYDTLGWSTVISMIDPSNTRSVALAQRLGCAPGEGYDHPTLGHMHIWRHPGPETLT